MYSFNDVRFVLITRGNYLLKLAPEALYTTSNIMQTRVKILLLYAFLLKYKILLLQTLSEFFLFVDRRTMIYVVGKYQEKTDFDSSSGHLQAVFIK